MDKALAKGGAACGCCVGLPMLICMMGSMVTFYQKDFHMLYADSYEESDSIWTTKKLRMRIVHTSADKWGVSFGNVGVASVDAGGAGGSAGATGTSLGQITTTRAGDLIDHEVVTTDNGDRIYVPLDSDEFLESDLWMDVICVSLALSCFSFVVIKVYKVYLLYVLVHPEVDENKPTKLFELFVDFENHRCKDVIKFLWLPIDFIVLSWGPNQALGTLISIHAEDEYANTAITYYNWWMLFSSFLFPAAIVAFMCLFAADSCNGKEPAKNCCFRCELIIIRGFLLFIILGSTCLFFYSMTIQFSIVLAVDITLMFDFSFRFGLVVWASFFRFFNGIWVATELVLTIALTIMAKTDLHHRPDHHGQAAES